MTLGLGFLLAFFICVVALGILMRARGRSSNSMVMVLEGLEYVGKPALTGDLKFILGLSVMLTLSGIVFIAQTGLGTPALTVGLILQGVFWVALGRRKKSARIAEEAIRKSIGK